MPEPPAVVRHISDTALWAAYFRAEETKRPDALFRDPYAEILEGGKGAEIARTIPEGQAHAWAWVSRTYLFDQLIRKEIEQGADLIVNCAAGLDARPYRMELPSSLQWFELDLPDILSYKEERLGKEKPRCVLERIRVNLANASERRGVLESVGTKGKRGVILTEGLLIYLSPEEVASFARDLAGIASFQRWILDMASPGLLRMMQKTAGKALERVGAPFRFGPAEGPGFFGSHGWDAVQVQGVLKTAARFRRPPFILRLLAKLPESTGAQGNRPWSGVCLLQKHRSRIDKG
ncbi:MAG TPA: SAM-dependent methyltransferase [Candidatus Sulfotelmatobacter sp.]|nr:SAM-dependent methyltransferase [Candidatus Sulfotelmatobacter sp.]